MEKKFHSPLSSDVFYCCSSVKGLMESDYVNAKNFYSTDLIISKFKVTSILVTSYDSE